jgi:hypothetical protein
MSAIKDEPVPFVAEGARSAEAPDAGVPAWEWLMPEEAALIELAGMLAAFNEQSDLWGRTAAIMNGQWQRLKLRGDKAAASGFFEKRQAAVAARQECERRVELLKAQIANTKSVRGSP